MTNKKENKINVRQVQQKELLIEQLKKTPIVQVACSKAAIGRATYYRWLKDDEKFCEEALTALSDGKQMVNDIAESQLIKAIQEENLTAIIFWLKNHHKDYGNKLEVSGNITTKNGDLSEEEKEKIRVALRMGGLTEEINF